MIRRVVRAVGEELRDLPAVQNPEVRRYLKSPANCFFLLFAAVLFAVSWPTLPLTHELPAYALPVVAAFVALPVALAWSAPLIGWLISAVAALAMWLVPDVEDFDWTWQIQVTHIIAFLVLTFMAYLRCPLQLLVPVWLGASAVMAVSSPADARVGWFVGLTSLMVMVALLRGLLGTRHQLAVRTEERRAAESESAVLQERARIARDLHDVVAHRMSMVVVMAQTARYRVSDVSDPAAAEFEAIADAARTSLDEVRQLLGVLRVADGPDGDGVEGGQGGWGTAEVAPNPGLAQIDSLITATRRAGGQVEFVDDLAHDEFGESSALVIYRIVQESLANATRHAPGGRIEVLLTPAEAGSAGEVTVRNAPGTEPPLELTGAGVGIPGMADRAGAVGGSLRANPTADGGFLVRAWIPAAVRSGSDAG